MRMPGEGVCFRLASKSSALVTGSSFASLLTGSSSSPFSIIGTARKRVLRMTCPSGANSPENGAIAIIIRSLAMFAPGVAGLALEFAICCFKAAKIIKHTIETMKQARNDLLELLRRIERTRLILELLRSLAQQLQDSGHADWFVNLGESDCRRTINEIQNIAEQVAKARSSFKLLGGAKWTYDKKRAQELVKSLTERETEINMAVTLVSAKLTAETHQTVRRSKDQYKTTSTVPFIKDDMLSTSEASSSETPLGTWLGQNIADFHDPDYLEGRSALYNSAYEGKWDDFWTNLENGIEAFDESWINAVRIVPLNQADFVSLWTPLHQAVYHGASPEVVKAMVDNGAFRTLPSAWANPEVFPHKDMTPLELAQNLGYVDLYEILSPVFRFHVPPQTIERLQNYFHEVIRRDLNQRVVAERIRLPVLSVLLELKIPQLKFPIHNHPNSPAGYVYRLDGRNLVVKSVNMTEPGKVVYYRITEVGYAEVEEPLVDDVYEFETQ